MKYIILFAFLVSTPASAADFPGGSPGNLEDEFKKGFGEDQGMQNSDQKAVDADRLKIGGSLQLEWQIYQLEMASRKDFVANPATLEMYLDSQLKNDVRAFARGRLIHDSSIDETLPSPLTGALQKQTTSSLDELKLSFNTKRKVFWTFGKQKIKWGASKFWNPTDFLNIQKRDLLRPEDLRAGISMIKAHVPIGNSNFYLIAVNDGADETAQTGLAARAEIPFSFGEWSLSTYNRKYLPTRLGTDVSIAVGDFDVYAEGATSKQGDVQSKSLSGGLSYGFKYNDEDVVTLGTEGFWQEVGTEKVADYPVLIASNRWVPFYVAKSYLLASMYLPAPGSFNDSDYMLYVIQNLSDQSHYYRLSWTYRGMSDLMWTVAIGNRGGEAGTEMKIFNLGLDGWLQMKASF